LQNFPEGVFETFKMHQKRFKKSPGDEKYKRNREKGNFSFTRDCTIPLLGNNCFNNSESDMNKTLKLKVF
jgi:hypothetical protein